jgi:hypothetical protein
MPARSQLIQLATKFAILVCALFLVSVLLAAMPGHHTPGVQPQESQQPAASQPQQSQAMDSNMPGTDMDDAKANEAHAVHHMTPGHHDVYPYEDSPDKIFAMHHDD